jgi:hypothetical protein
MAASFCRVYKKGALPADSSKIRLAISPEQSDRCVDRNPVKENTDEHEHHRYGENRDAGSWRSATQAHAQTRQEVEGRKEGAPGQKAAAKPKADRANKKAEVIALMKRAKGATLARSGLKNNLGYWCFF